MVYVAMSADVLHHGQINILREASKYGDVIVGLHTDKVIASYWHVPILPYEEREKIVSSIKYVSKVVEQDDLDQVPNLIKYRPEYVVHGDSWQWDSQKYLRQRVVDAIREWDGTLIEIPRTTGEGVSNLEGTIRHLGTTSDFRRAALRRLLNIKGQIRALEAHNGLTGLIVENTKRVMEDAKIRQFDAMWISSLCDSTAKGKPDIELVDITSRLNTINEILEVTTKPIIVDGDTGGKIEHFAYTVRSLERLGVSAVIIEDKVGLKKNSLLGTDVEQTQDTIEGFCEKIKSGKNAQVTSDFMIIARIESLILGAPMEDALIRAKAYIDAGADAIMIHSIDKTGMEIRDFCKNYKDAGLSVPIVVVPTVFDQVMEEELFEWGCNLVIYANHLIRSAYKAMSEVAYEILDSHRALEVRDKCIEIERILSIV